MSFFGLSKTAPSNPQPNAIAYL